MGAILLSLLYAFLTCVFIIFIAVVFVWAFKWLTNRDIDADVKKWGGALVVLMCIIVLVTWLLSAIGWLPGAPYMGGRFLG